MVTSEKEAVTASSRWRLFYRPGAGRRPIADGVTSSRHHHAVAQRSERSLQRTGLRQATATPAFAQPPVGKVLDTRFFGGVSVRIFWEAALPEVLHGTINLNPIMFRLFENRYDGGWVLWFCHRADCNGDQRG